MTDKELNPMAESGGFTPACPHKRNRDDEWCELCFRAEQRQRWGYSPHNFCDFLGRTNG